MVRRMLNHPVKMDNGRGSALFWFRQVGSIWICSECKKTQPAFTVCFEVSYRRTFFINPVVGIEKNDNTNVIPPTQDIGKKFFCLPCACKLFDNIKEDAKLIEQQGADAYRLIKQL